MTQDQITALAREYAEECAEEVGVMFNPQDWACSHCEIEARAVIKFLLRRYCLVEKSKVEEEYNLATKQTVAKEFKEEVRRAKFKCGGEPDKDSSLKKNKSDNYGYSNS